MKIKNFGVEIWMNANENHCRYNIAETCVASLTVEQLLDMSGRKHDLLDELLPMKLTYGPIEGSDRLRDNVAGLFADQSRDNVIITHGAIGANALAYQTLVEPGDTVVSILPTYQQHYSIPESLGADVKILWLREENDFLPDLDELASLVTPGTKLIAVNNPNNPTGALLDEQMLRGIATIADKVGAYVLCDEVYRGVAIDSDEIGLSILDVYPLGISTGSMSKAFSLAGLRLGWIVGPAELMHAVSIHRDYNTISVGMVNDLLAAIALDNKDAILARSRSIVRANLAVLDEWVQAEPRIGYVRPMAGTTALLKYDVDRPSEELAKEILATTGALLTPGSALSMEGYLRIGYANDTDVLRAGLDRVSAYIRENW